ncbi:MAG: FixH family protein [Bacteroidota bacterium]|nr:FixH family protein [Bacteroidota bacterium]MDX5404147.1 FixH family protein [Bacteroidota bacterium]MDX5428179.1 FixH family protein [Bacteroidota bacterium]MDX5447836.1 FixH family protein [Bacteroidota bacterium]MDX5505963.1 FixH family protein [Bacteroidota bacterium]
MKFNWGTGIVIALTLFASGILYVVYRSVSEKVELVTEDYYSQELVYQDRIDEIARGKAAGEVVIRRKAEDTIEIELPEKISGDAGTYSIHFYKPDNSNLDFVEEIKLEGGQRLMVIERNVIPGKWLVKISGMTNQISYYWEVNTFL